jgi:addiction module RelE/StbE family toxin
MEYILSRKFEKQFSKLPQKIKDKAIKQFETFVDDPFDFKLNNHSLSGKQKNQRSVNINADIRAIYEVLEKDKLVIFVAIGSHSELYS